MCMYCCKCGSDFRPDINAYYVSHNDYSNAKHIAYPEAILGTPALGGTWAPAPPRA